MQFFYRHLRYCALQAELPPWIVFSDFERTEWLTQMLGAHPPSRDSHWARRQHSYRYGLCVKASRAHASILPQAPV